MRRNLLAIAVLTAAAFGSTTSHAAPKCGEGVQQDCTYTADDGTQHLCEAWVQQHVATWRAYACGAPDGFAAAGIEFGP